MSGNNNGRCVHCDERKATRARGLCDRCHRNQDIREVYPAKAGWWGNDNDSMRRSLPTTDAAICLPGTEERLVVMSLRAERGESLHHPEDRRIDGESGFDPRFLHNDSGTNESRRGKNKRCKVHLNRGSETTQLESRLRDPKSISRGSRVRLRDRGGRRL